MTLGLLAACAFDLFHHAQESFHQPSPMVPREGLPVVALAKTG
jgi:hypothetical protein